MSSFLGLYKVSLQILIVQLPQRIMPRYPPILSLPPSQ